MAHMYSVIIVEDDPMVAAINLKYTQMNSNLEVVGQFTNGKDALDFLETHEADLAIVVLYMPVMNGVDFMQELRNRKHPIDLIVVTAANDADHIRQLLSLGVIEYLIKPYEYDRFNQALSTFLEYKENLASEQHLTQHQLDQLLRRNNTELNTSEALGKGLQQKTLDLIMNYMKEHIGEGLTSERLSTDTNLSRVTIRRYMNYLLEKEIITSEIDYSTGGRPSIIYHYHG